MKLKNELLGLLTDAELKPNNLFNKLFDLFRKTPGRIITQEKYLNRVGFNQTTLNTLLYELKKLYGVTDSDIKKHLNDGNLKINEVKNKSLNDNSKEIKQTIEVFENASTEVKQEIRFRDEFPFINDPELPVELKILVTDKFNHYFAFCDSHKELFDSVVLPLLEGKNFNEVESISNDKIFELAKIAVGNFEMDQLIRDEFVYYRDEHKILGVHPIFKERKLQEFVNNMTIADAAKRATNLENYIRRDTNNAEKATKPEDKIRLEGKVIEWKRELVLVNLKLGIQDAGK
ncbi:hypothetical protein LIT13_01325 [Flavobacterium psychrophilum]|uniref:Uncharacterized protein n=6 Tax=root TaxID=1 RepID=A6GXS4_FLAPJ|nr:hypothetical protein [Flavobacterium psychrophilum]YP_008320437.1 hypothetical protein N375_gp23 [Flavobacterium phage 6H]YP_009321839.1 hypothetical protein BOX11_gp18 [Flavobacterium phage 1H]YP_009322896.1 hypothetical protein BOX10_gp24 [Flavobacterium phage 2A]YP_009592331.1 hypothetical protein FDG69_gp23 [Flavobacterium phage 23T]QCW20060.1 hypothetical protein [Flavobacterium phage FPSV-D15]QCW20215.1 hypothetical protein [Flavobacterium phage FPSV-F7]QCW20750.1 hypothetical prote